MKHLTIIARLFAIITAISMVMATTGYAKALSSEKYVAQMDRSGNKNVEQAKDSALADVYFENGTIYTADANDSIVEALAVKDGIIVFAGTAKDGETYRQGASEIVDLEGKMLMPGFIDGHFHSVSPGFFDFNLSGLVNVDDIINAIEDAVDAKPNNETYTGWAFSDAVFTDGEEESRGPHKSRLDAICPDKPMMIYADDGHSAWLNTKAFELLGIDSSMESPRGGIIEKDNDGELWGVLRDAAMALTDEYPFNNEAVSFALKELMGELSSLGYTSILTPPGNGFLPIPYDLYDQMEKDGELTVRIRACGGITEWRVEQDLQALKDAKEKYNSEMFKVIAAKFFSDGVINSGTAYLLEPYSRSDVDTYGEPGYEQDIYNHAVTAVNEMGLIAHAHAIGDAAFRITVNAMEYAVEQLGDGDYRNAITHLQLVSPDDILRAAELDIIAVANPYWHFKYPMYWEEVEFGMIGERAEKMYPMKSFIDAGMLLTFASDYPVTYVPSPFLAIQAGLTRNLVHDTEFGIPDITDVDDPKYLLWPEERVSLIDMLRGFTINGAYSIFEEKNTGSLETGKSADMVILDRDLFSAELLKIYETQILRTYLKGQVVFDKEAM